MDTPTTIKGLVAIIFLSSILNIHSYGKVPSDTTYQIKHYMTSKVKGAPPLIDGKLNDPAWKEVDWAGDFITYQPEEGKTPAQKTDFKVLYDDKNLYVGILCHDTDPSKIVKRLGRRDNVDGDFVAVIIDSYFDHLTGFEFDVNAVGVIGDAYITNDGNNKEEYSWDPVWYQKTSSDTSRSSVEIRIPLSQLRFSDKQDQVWGFEVIRQDFRKGEMSLWQPIPKSAPGFIHLLGELHGLEGLKQQRQLEIMPYVVGKIENSEKIAGNPYATGSRKTLNGGLDGKIGLSSNFTLDLTINPDFGQVEADPSVVNLTGFQNYFSEKRPFFVESNNLLDYPVSQSIAWGSFNSDDLFYSRRIGHSPQGSPDVPDGGYSRSPEYTTILGAMKLTGKTQKGLSVGVLESVTQRELAKISDGTHESTQVVEPLTNYFETRILQDYNQGNTQIGGIITAVNRDIRNPEVDFLRRSAYTGGLDFIHNWKKKTWYLSGNMIFSQVYGSTRAITATQTSQEHLFQRPGYGKYKVDSTLTSMNGTGATLKFGKGGNGVIQFQVGGTYKSPSLELNDIGYLYKAGAIYQFAWASYHVYNPWWIFNRFQCNVNQWTNYDFTGTNLYKAANYNMNMQFKNYYSFGTGITYTFYNFDNDILRGGPSLRLPAGAQIQSWVSSDYRKKLTLQLSHTYTYGLEKYQNSNDFYLWMNYQPLKNLSFSLSPGYSVNKNSIQYVTGVEINNKTNYIVADLDQVTASLTARVNISLTPSLTIQYYGQPFVSRGIYTAFKKITNPGAKSFQNRFHQYVDGELTFNETGNQYQVNGSQGFAFDNPNFDYLQFNSNLVLRWEYKPGSTFFLVWSQNRTGNNLLENQNVGNLTDNLFQVFPNDIFLVKFSYRFIR